MANEVSRASDRLMCCSDDADRNGGRLLLLGNGRISESKAQESSEKRVSHLGSGVTLSNWAISIRSVAVTTAGFRQLQNFWQKGRAIFDKSAAFLMIPLQSSNERDEEVRLQTDD